MSEIWAVLEQKEGSLQEQSGELLAALHEIAQRQSEPATLCAILLTGQNTLSADTPPDTPSNIPWIPRYSPGWVCNNSICLTSIAGLLHYGGSMSTHCSGCCSNTHPCWWQQAPLPMGATGCHGWQLACTCPLSLAASTLTCTMMACWPCARFMKAAPTPRQYRAARAHRAGDPHTRRAWYTCQYPAWCNVRHISHYHPFDA